MLIKVSCSNKLIEFLNKFKYLLDDNLKIYCNTNSIFNFFLKKKLIKATVIYLNNSSRYNATKKYFTAQTKVKKMINFMCFWFKFSHQ